MRLGVPADAVTVAGAALACLAVPAAAAGRPLLAGALVLLSGVLDGLDGAVARGSGRTSAHGAWLDRAADRVGELAAALALVLLGAPWWVAAAAVVLGAAMEVVRTLDRRSGRPERPATVGERPTRVLVAGMFAAAAGATGGWTAAWSDLPWAGLGAAVWALAVAVGLVQLVARSGRADEPGDDLR